MEDKILATIKKMIGISEDHNRFDADLIVYINNAIFKLRQLGIGKEDFGYANSEQTWSEFIDDDTILGTVQSYVANTVKILFDPPSSSFVLESIKNQMLELEWRLNLHSEADFITKRK